MAANEKEQGFRAPVTKSTTYARPAPWKRWVRNIVLLAVFFPLLAQVITLGSQLYGEWEALQVEQRNDRISRPIGYEGIHLMPSFAERPPNWIHDEADMTCLWSGWDDKAGHGWFRVPKGELDPKAIQGGWGRDSVRPVDWPIVEVGDGKRWRRLPPEAVVVGFVFAGAPVAYPQILLEKVLVVNDLDQPHALLVTYTPQRPPEEAYEAYDPMLDGHRVTLGLTGYTYHNRPLYYDRGTTSFWVTQEAGIVAIAGALKGTTLPRVAQLDRSSWKDWVQGNPRTRLLVGSDRSQKDPEY